MSITDQFNHKWQDLIPKGYGGLQIENQEIADFLTDIFKNVLIHIPTFEFYQAKGKFNYCRFYSNLQSPGLQAAIEITMKNILENG